MPRLKHTRGHSSSTTHSPTASQVGAWEHLVSNKAECCDPRFAQKERWSLSLPNAQPSTRRHLEPPGTSGAPWKGGGKRGAKSFLILPFGAELYRGVAATAPDDQCQLEAYFRTGLSELALWPSRGRQKPGLRLRTGALPAAEVLRKLREILRAGKRWRKRLCGPLDTHPAPRGGEASAHPPLGLRPLQLKKTLENMVLSYGAAPKSLNLS